jgi:flavin-dependent dehydrogenase
MSHSTPAPQVADRYDVVVIGGGPAGSTSAAVLAERGFSVLVLERLAFPRFHIGESMLTYTAALLDRLGLGDRIRATDFPIKTGAEFCDQQGRSTRVDFTDQGEGRALTTFQVERSEFDSILLQNAVEKGAHVEHEARVNNVETADGRIVGVTYTKDNKRRMVSARHVLDASGRAGIITNQHLKSRKMAERLRMVAVFHHFDGVREDTNPGVEGDIQIGSHDDGWVWAIPIRPGKLSVGTVTRPQTLRDASSPEELFAHHVSRIPRIRQRIEGLDGGELRTESDFSYYSDTVTGPGFFVVGDAGCFIDPIFSAGVYLAVSSGVKAAELTAELLSGNLSEEDAGDQYGRFYKTGYDTYFRLICAFYDHDFKIGRFLKSTGVRVDPVWVARLLGGDFWSAKNALGNHLRALPEYTTFAAYEPLFGCPVYPDIDEQEPQAPSLDSRPVTVEHR